MNEQDLKLLYSGFIRSVGGWNRFAVLFNESLKGVGSKEAIAIITDSLITRSGAYILDTLIENKKDKVFAFLEAQNKKSMEDQLSRYHGNQIKEVCRNLFILGVLKYYRKERAVFDSLEKPDETFDPLLEGITHINVYTKSIFTLGQGLSNLSDRSVELPEGHFQSLEGYWYWLLTGGQDEGFKTLHGYNAKKKGVKMLEEGLGVISSEDEAFRERFKSALRCKLRQHPDLLTELVKSTLPLKHYYYHQGTKDTLSFKIVDKSNHQWQLDEIEKVREICQKKMAEVGQLSAYPPDENELKAILRPRFK